MKTRYSGKSFKDSSTMKKAKLSIREKRKLKREKKKKRQIYKMLDEHGEEEDEKTKRDLEILKKYHKKEIKSVKKIFITLFLIFALVYIVKLLMGFF